MCIYRVSRSSTDFPAKALLTVPWDLAKPDLLWKVHSDEVVDVHISLTHFSAHLCLGWNVSWIPCRASRLRFWHFMAMFLSAPPDKVTLYCCRM